jgi:4-amino-4-deoxy-L-arabinose transferase-like glycosyltransferase
VIEIDARRPSRRRDLVAVAVSTAAGLAALLAWTVWTPVPVLRQQLTILQWWSLESCVALGLALSVFLLREMTTAITRRDVLAMALPLVVGLVLTLAVAPRTNRIFYDEQIYQNVGQNLADLHRAQMCNDGAVEAGRLHCYRWEYNKQPYAYPHLLSLIYQAVGAGPTPAFIVNAAAMGLSICLVYLLVAILFSDRVAAFFAALLLALTPQQVVWSASGAVEPSASAACVAALVAAAWFARSRSTLALAGASVAAAYAVQFRPESLLIVPVIALLLWQRTREEFGRPRLWWAAALFVALTSVHVAHTAAIRNEGWGTGQARMSLSYVADNLKANGWFYLADRRFPALYTALALIGVWCRRREAGRLTIALYFIAFFGVALLFYAGSYDYGQDVRYSLATYPPLMIAGGLGLSRAAAWLERARTGRVVRPAMTLLLIAQFAWYLPAVRAVSDGAWAARADVQFAASLMPDLPADAYVLTQNPGMFQVSGISAGQVSLAVDDPVRLDALAQRYTGGVYFHWNFWCNVQDPVQRGFCTRLLEQWVRDQHFALYRLRRSIASR